MSRYTMRIAVYTYNDILHCRDIFQFLYIHAYCSHADDIVFASDLKKLYAHFGFVLTLFIHGIYLYIPCISCNVACFHIAQDKSVIFLLQGSVLTFGHASIHTPCTAQHILQPKVKKTCLQELDCVYSMCIMPYSMHIMLYTSIYHPLLCIRLDTSRSVLARGPTHCVLGTGCSFDGHLPVL